MAVTYSHHTRPSGTTAAAPSPGTTTRRVRALVALALALLVLAALLVPAPASALPYRIYRISADGTPGAGGHRWKAAGTIEDLPRYLRKAEPGDQIWIRGGAAKGTYHTTRPVVLDAGGSAQAPVIIRGVDFHGTSDTTPTFVGTRTAPYDPSGDPGKELFRLVGGADNLVFENMEFKNQGNGAFRVGADIANLTIRDMHATNVRRFFESYPSGGASSASVAGLRVSNVTVDGFSRGVFRLRDDTRDVVISDVVGDSQRQDGDNFAMGVHLTGTVHDVLFERVTMRNSHDTTNSYWNGDGFAAERGTHHLTFVDTVATGSTDAGYDLKSSATTLIRTVAEDNKRNYRLWDQADVIDSVSRDPLKRGGSGSQAQIWAGSNARVTVTGSTVTDQRSNTVVFEVDDSAQVTVKDTTVVHAPEAKAATISKNALLLQ